MAELLLLAQCALFVAGWFSYLHFRRRLAEEVRSQSLALEMESLERRMQQLLSKLVSESERAARELDARIRRMEYAEPGRDARRVDPAAVWALAENGLAAAEIARKTGRPLAEIELILSLPRHALARNPPNRVGSEHQEEM